MPGIYVVYFRVILFLLLCSPSVRAQLPSIHPVPLPAGSIGGITGIAQDMQGYMWFTTPSGLHRYDGYHYVSYTPTALDTNSIAPNPGRAICAGRSGFIWVTTDWGLDRLDPATGKVTHYRLPATALLEDRRGNLWIGSREGLLAMHTQTGKITRYRHNPHDTTSLTKGPVTVLYEDRQGDLWIGTGSAFDKENTEGGLNHFDYQTGRFTRYQHDPKHAYSLLDNRVGALFEDSKGNFWVGTAGDGLHRMNRQQGIFHRYAYDPHHPDKLSRPPQKNIYSWAVDHITFIQEDASGALWIGTFEGGINRFDPSSGKSTHYPSFQDSTTAVADYNVFSCATVSREGVLWIGTWYGLYRIDPMQISIPHVDIGKPVFSLYQDTTGIIWLGTDAGVLQVNPMTLKKNWHSHQPHQSDGLSHNTVTALYRDRQGTLWAGTEAGINYLDAQTGTFTRYRSREQNSLDREGISTFLEDRQGQFWVATYKGLKRLDRKTGFCTSYFTNRAVGYLAEDPLGYLWVGMYWGELYRLDPATGKTQLYLSGARLSSLLIDAQGTIWAGTINGLYRSNASRNDFSLFTDSGNLLNGSIVVNGMLEDNDGNMWVNTTQGLLRLNQQRNQTSRLGPERGIVPELIWANQCQYFKGKSGELLIGDRTGKGYYAFMPRQFSTNRIAPHVVINEFRLADQVLKPGPKSLLTQPLSQTREIHLPHHQNVFFISFAGIHYTSPEANRHLFKLENLDDRWRKPGEEKQAYYYNVPPGEYLFRVKASNSDGIWAEKKVWVIVHPPWWLTTWAYIFYGICLLGGLFAVGSFQHRRVVRKEQEKARLRELQQAKEIEKAYYQLEQKSTELAQQKEELESTLDYLKTTQIQLVEQEKAALENELKVERLTKEQALATYQSRMSELEMQALRAQMNPHFIFNCLNSIDGFILKNESETASDYLTKFSRLIRLILQNSQSKLVPLENELQALKLYIEMEILRFDGKFSYELVVDPYLDIEEIDIAPLLIQPYVENAIWHGLMHKQGHGHLCIELQMKGDHLHCQITDDGVGRKRSNELKSKSAHKGKSLGMQITAHRLELINALQEQVTTVEILDLVDAAGEACGTKVLLNIPI